VVRNFANEPRHLRIRGSVTDSPEVTGTSSIVPTLTKGSQSTLTPTSTASSSSSSSSSKGSSNSGAIAGGVVGGILGAALIAGIVAWFAIRRKRARSTPSEAYMGDQGGMGQAYPLTAGTPKLYVSFLFWPPRAGVRECD
jgi:hypothetical protein